MDELYSTVTKAIKEEDRKRLLYSLVGASSESVKLPKFSGSLGEDFSTFKSKLLLGLEKNRVAATDEIEKLRSCLSGQALALVPEKFKDFDAAMKVLADAFGDSEKVLGDRDALERQCVSPVSGLLDALCASNEAGGQTVDVIVPLLLHK